jgi:putative membrane protein
MTDQTRKPKVFDLDDPELAEIETAPAEPWNEPAADSPLMEQPARIPSVLDRARQGFHWGALLVSAALSLIVMALILNFWSFVWGLFQRSDWVGWTALVLAVLLCVSVVMLILAEIVGFLRIGRLRRWRASADRVLADPATAKTSDAAVVTKGLAGLYADRVELGWAISGYRAHDADIMAPAERLALFDRTVLSAVDDQVRLIIGQSARRVAIVTAITPFIIVDMVFVLYENFRMLRRVATLYGGRPGMLGLLRLGGRVLSHLVATGGLALTDDLLGQFIGQGVIKRLSARAGEGVFNGALTARIGIAAIDLCRPLPFIKAQPVRLRELAGDLFRSLTGGNTRSAK